MAFEATVVIPAYNNWRALELTLAALERQTTPHDQFEVIVVDDGSSDGTSELLRSARPTFELRCLHQPNRGRSAARNLGIRQAMGRVVLLVDADTLPSTTLLEDHLRHHAGGGETVVIGRKAHVLARWEKGMPAHLLDELEAQAAGDVETSAQIRRARAGEEVTFVTREDVERRFERIAQRTVGAIYSHHEEVCAVYSERLTGFKVAWVLFTSNNVSFPRTLIERSGPFEESFRGWGCEDVELGYRFQRCGAKFHYVARAVTYHQLHRGGAVADLDAWRENARNYEVFLRKHPTLDVFLWWRFVAGLLPGDAYNSLVIENECLQRCGGEEVTAEYLKECERQAFASCLLEDPRPSGLAASVLAREVTRPRPTKVSVVIPMRNAATTIGDQLHALSAQQYSGSWEVVVADNGSQDGGDEVARRFCDSLPSLRIIDASARTGVNHARNRGAAEARGDFIAYCDADDVVMPGWLEAMADAARLFDVVGGVLDPRPLTSSGTHEVGENLARNGLHINLDCLPYATGANFGIWKNALDRLNGWDEAYAKGGDDVDLCWRAQLAGHHVGFASKAVVGYRLRPTFRAMFRQHFGYGLADAQLDRNYRLPPTTARWAVRESSKLLMHAQDLLSESRRLTWANSSGYLSGRLFGVLRFGQPPVAFSALPSGGLHVGLWWAHKYLGRGWSTYGEGEYRWTHGRRGAVVRFSLAAPPPGVLELEMMPYLASGEMSKQRVIVWLNGRKLETLVLRNRDFATYSVALPEGATKQANVLCLRLPDAASPADLEASTDRRRLGVAVRLLRWRAK